MKRLLFS